MRNVTLTDEQYRNLLAFLNRVDYKGLKEVEAVNDILVALNDRKEDKENIDNS